MPSDRLHPLVMPNGTAIVAAAYNYRDTTVELHAEVPVAIPVVFNRNPSRLSSLMPGWIKCQFIFARALSP